MNGNTRTIHTAACMQTSVQRDFSGHARFSLPRAPPPPSATQPIGYCHRQHHDNACKCTLAGQSGHKARTCKAPPSMRIALANAKMTKLQRCSACGAHLKTTQPCAKSAMAPLAHLVSRKRCKRLVNSGHPDHLSPLLAFKCRWARTQDPHLPPLRLAQHRFGSLDRK